MANYGVVPLSVFPSGVVNYQFCHDNGIGISTKVTSDPDTPSNFAMCIAATVYAKVALYYIDSEFGIVVGVALNPSSWSSTVKVGLSWWDSNVNGYSPTATGSYSDFYYGYNIGAYGYSTLKTSPVLHVFSDINSALADMDDGIWDYAPTTYPITYRLTNAATTGPNEAAVGDTVTVPLTFPEGYGVVNPSSDAYVTCNGVIVPSTYTEGQLVFTMPDPS